MLVTEKLKKEDFGVLSEIDVIETLKKKIDVEFRHYKLPGTYNPYLAHKTLNIGGTTGIFLPCGVIVEENENGTTAIAIVDPISAMRSAKNKELVTLAIEVQQKLQKGFSQLINRLTFIQHG